MIFDVCLSIICERFLDKFICKFVFLERFMQGRDLTYSGAMKQFCYGSLPASLLLLFLLLLLLKLPLLYQTVAIVGQLMLQHVAKFICIFLWLFPLLFAVAACVTRFFLPPATSSLELHPLLLCPRPPLAFL